MADYHPLITRAVSGLEKDTAENRRVLYERARTALVSQLRGNVPPLDESEITRERLALEEAIRKVEVESARRAREAPKPDPLAAKRADDAVRREEMVRREEAARREEAIQRDEAARREEAARHEEAAQRDEAARREEALQRESALRREEDILREAAEQAAKSTPDVTPTIEPVPIASKPAQTSLDSPAAARPEVWRPSEHAVLLDNALKEFSEAVGKPGRSNERVRAAPPPRPVIAPIVPLPPAVTPQYPDPVPPSYQPPPLQPASPPQPAPPLLDALKELESFEAPLTHEEWRTPPAEQAEPLQTFDFDETGVRSTPQEFARHAEEPDHSPRPLRSYRKLIWICIGSVLAFGGGATAYWQSDNIVGAVRGVVTSIRGPATQAQRDPAPARQKNTDRIGQPEFQQAPKSATMAAQRALLTTEPDTNNPGGKDYVGTANWRIETIAAAPGRAAEIAIKLEVEIPDRGLAMNWLIRRNVDPTLPASHTIDIEFNMAPNSALGDISDIRSLLMKQPGQTEGAPLWGHAQKSTANYFLVGLSATDADAQYNLRLLKGQPAFDIALVFTKARRAFLMIEKGPVGERVFADAFAAWKQ